MKKILLVILFLSFLIAVMGCDNSQMKTNEKKDTKMSELELDDSYIMALANYENIQNVSYSNSEESVLSNFIRLTIADILLNQKNINNIYSPLNIYLALAMLTETTKGNSLNELLNVLSVQSTKELEKESKNIFESVYNESDEIITKLGGSLWLNDSQTYDEKLVKKISETYYSSTFRGNMSDPLYTAELRKWTNNMTNNLLSDQVKEMEFDKNTMFAIVTTIYFKGIFYDQFRNELNTEDDFYMYDKIVSTEYMHMVNTCQYNLEKMYSSISLGMYGGAKIKFLKPNDDYTTSDLLKDQETVNHIITGYSNSQSSKKVEMSIPKFDVSSNIDLIPYLKTIGVNSIFNPSLDFSPLVKDSFPLFIDKIIHGARVKINEEGVEAAAFTEIMNKATSSGPTETVEFKLNKPFVFVIYSSNNVPLFIGTVNNPNIR